MTKTQAPLVFIINSLYTGGAERLVIDTINELLRRGVPVRLITLRPEKPGASLAPELAIPAADWRIIQFKSFLSMRSWFRLIRTLREWRPRVVLTYLWFSNTIGRIAAWCAGIRPVISFELNVYDRVKSRRQFFADRVLSHFCSRIIAVSQSSRESLVRHGIRPESIMLLQNSIACGAAPGMGRDNMRESLGIAEGEFIFLFIGRLVRQKGADILLDAFATIPDGTLLIVGAGEEESELKRQASVLHLGRRVKFLGSRRDLANLFLIADVFVIPSRWEGIPMVLLAAMAAGKTIVASDIPGIAEVVSDGAQGILVAPEDSAGLAAAFIRLRRDPELRERLAMAAHTRAKDFSIDRYCEKLLAIIESLYIEDVPAL